MQNGYVRDKAYKYPEHDENGNWVSPHAEAIQVQNGKIYVLYGLSYSGVNYYEASEIVEFDASLNVLRRVKLKDNNGKFARNTLSMAYSGGALYAAAIGGFQGPDSWGDLWRVDLASMTARQVLDGHDIPCAVNGQPVNVGLYSVQFAADGTAFLLAGSYSADYTFRARLFVTTEAALSSGNAGTVAKEYTQDFGYSWNILWDKEDSILWCMTGKSLEARSKSGNLVRSFTPAELGDNIYSVAIFNGSYSTDTPNTPDNPSDPDTPNTPDNPDSPPPGNSWIIEPPVTIAPVHEGVEVTADAKTFNSAASLPEKLARAVTRGMIEIVSGIAQANPFATIGALAPADGKEIGNTNAVPLPVFATNVSKAGNTALVTFDADLGALSSLAFSKIAVIKPRPDGVSKILTELSTSDDLTDGQYAWTRKGGKTYLTVAIKDNGPNDWDDAPGTVADPLTLAARTDPTPETPDGPDTPDEPDGPATPDNPNIPVTPGKPDNGGGGGGCNAGFGAFGALVLAIALADKKR
jgi:hypothetical protein